MLPRIRPLAFVVLLILAGLSTTVQATADRTVEIVAVVHCEEQPTTVCGFASEDELRDMMRTRLDWTNELFRPNAISFRLDEVHVIEDDDAVRSESRWAGGPGKVDFMGSTRVEDWETRSTTASEKSSGSVQREREPRRRH